jgi:hypothetical protein
MQVFAKWISVGLLGLFALVTVVAGSSQGEPQEAADPAVQVAGE